ncbi:ubiquitin-fold modifier 1-like [Cavia porcellus]|uniref:ubiquitin-fold modifier 1-like n=1 Tax=Cavia porcellus TaxID=10141 RepID=UPI002FE2AA38
MLKVSFKSMLMSDMQFPYNVFSVPESILLMAVLKFVAEFKVPTVISKIIIQPRLGINPATTAGNVFLEHGLEL